MTDVLTPQLALAYLAELQPSLSAVAIVDETGRLLAGEDPGDAPPTLTVARDGYEIRAVAGPGAVAGTGAVAGPGAGLDELTRLDLETALADLAGRPGGA
jgi:hypothetical protein